MSLLLALSDQLTWNKYAVTPSSAYLLQDRILEIGQSIGSAGSQVTQIFR